MFVRDHFYFCVPREKFLRGHAEILPQAGSYFSMGTNLNYFSPNRQSYSHQTDVSSFPSNRLNILPSAQTEELLRSVRNLFQQRKQPVSDMYKSGRSIQPLPFCSDIFQKLHHNRVLRFSCRYKIKIAGWRCRIFSLCNSLHQFIQGSIKFFFLIQFSITISHQ